MPIISRFTIAAILGTASSLVGLFFAKRLRSRANYFEALHNFCLHILTEVKFRKNTIDEITKDFIKTNPSIMDKNLGEFLAKSKLSRGCLKKEELAKAVGFLTSLGTLDSETQIYELETYRENFSAEKEKARQRAEKFSPMFVKLGFLAGLALAIVFI